MNHSTEFDAREQAINALLGELRTSAPNQKLAHALAQYALERRPFALAEKSDQDLSALDSRTGDLIAGVPYASPKHPWPTSTTNGLLMQPLLQLQLSTLTRLFQVNWGDGLLQVWVFVGSTPKELALASNPLSLRLIPAADLVDDCITPPPDWRTQNGKRCALLFNEQTYSEGIGMQCDWENAGRMYASRFHLHQMAAKQVGLFGDEEFEWLDGVIERLSESPLCAERQSEYLGGWGGQDGESDASARDGLVVRISDGDGLVVAVHRTPGPSKVGQFKVSYSIR